MSTPVNIRDLAAGTAIVLVDGAEAEILDNPGDGVWLFARYLSSPRDPTLVGSFLRGNKYSFPVILSQDVAEKFFPTVRMPQSWIIDGQGRRLNYEPLLGDGLEEVAATLR